MAEASSAAVSRLKQHLDAFLRVTLTDGRILIGTFACFDKQRNILLNDAREFRAPLADDQPRSRSERNLGIVLVPRRWITAVHTMADNNDSA
jgi:small nuclear ribonucleoprotein (snRNP)-like protein